MMLPREHFDTLEGVFLVETILLGPSHQQATFYPS